MTLIHSNQLLENLSGAAAYEGETNELRVQILRSALPKVIENRLSSRQRECVKLYYFENLNMAQTAKRLGIERSTVSRTLKRARENIRLSLEYIL